MLFARPIRFLNSAISGTRSQLEKSAARANKKAVVDTVTVWLKVLVRASSKKP